MRERSQATFLITILAGLLLICAAWLTQAKAHDWYSGHRNAATGEGCCGSRDCFPLSYNDFYETADEYVVTLRGVVPGWNTGGPGRNVWRISKDKAQPTPHMDGKENETGYHACIWGGKLRCFFFPASS